MSSQVTVRTRKFMTNRLLSRKQMVVDVLHPGLANVSKADLKESIVKLYKVKDPETVTLFGFKTKFGGGRSTGFCLIYDTKADYLAFESRTSLKRAGILKTREISRKQIKEKKNRMKKYRGTKKGAAASAAGKKK